MRCPYAPVWCVPKPLHWCDQCRHYINRKEDTMEPDKYPDAKAYVSPQYPPKSELIFSIPLRSGMSPADLAAILAKLPGEAVLR
jgi:hypothetical protein